MTDPTMEHPDPSDRNAVDRYGREVLAPRTAGERADREQTLLGQENLLAGVETLLFHDDPIGINFERTPTNTGRRPRPSFSAWPRRRLSAMWQ